MFQTVLIGYDGPERGGEATALAEVLRGPYEGTLLLASAYLAEHLLRDAPCTVAVAPRGYSGGDIRRIGVAYDGSSEADAALHAARSLALELSARLTIYCAGWPSPAAEDVHFGLLEDAAQQLKPETLVVQVPAEEVTSRAYGVIDLLFVGSRGYDPLRRALLCNVSGAVVREAGCPVVVCPLPTAIAPRHAAKAEAMVSA